jgi:hypothetical protein
VRRPLFALSAIVFAAVVACAFAPSAAVGRIATDHPHGGWVRAEAPRPAPRPAHVIAYVRSGRALALRSRPFGPVVARVGSITRFGSRRALGVVTTRRGRWLAVTEAGIGNNRVVWVDAQAGGLRYTRTPLQLVVDLSRRTLDVRHGGKLVRRLTVAVGRSDSPTPTGRFSVTDKLNGGAFSASYGCCILALSATQPNLPAGWTGGNRIAIHGTLSADFGQAVSAGCMHARDTDLRYLTRIVPLGTPVVIRP